jgi:hypothetical protein
MPLAQWLQAQSPLCLTCVVSEPSGLVLTTATQASQSNYQSNSRWVLATFDDPEVKQAATTYQQRQQTSQGLHFLLVQPDDSGMTYTGFWLLKA